MMISLQTDLKIFWEYERSRGVIKNDLERQFLLHTSYALYAKNPNYITDIIANAILLHPENVKDKAYISKRTILNKDVTILIDPKDTNLSVSYKNIDVIFKNINVHILYSGIINTNKIKSI